MASRGDIGVARGGETLMVGTLILSFGRGLVKRSSKPSRSSRVETVYKGACGPVPRRFGLLAQLEQKS
jgi:hypothetical protein